MDGFPCIHILIITYVYIYIDIDTYIYNVCILEYILHNKQEWKRTST